MFFKVSHKVAVDDVFKDFTWNRNMGDGTIVFCRCLSPLRRPTRLQCASLRGKTAVSNDRWKMSLSAGVRALAQFFNIILGIWSGPHALLGLMALNKLHTPAVLMLISLIIGYNWVLWRVKVWGSRSTISGEDTLELVQKDLIPLLVVTPVNYSLSGGLLQCCLVFCF